MNITSTTGIIASHNATMISEEENVTASKEQLSSQYEIFSADNKELNDDWEGDTAEIFLKYSNQMNNMIEDTIKVTDVFGQNIWFFYTDSKELDTDAANNAGGEAE